jgi:hypothetical protein
VIDPRAAAQERWGRPPADEDVPPTDPRRAVGEAGTYFGNNAPRVDDPRYRRDGLPTTSSLGASRVGAFHARGKGRAKFWDRPAGAEAIRQGRAAPVSEDGRLARYFTERPGRLDRRRAA